jgi:hypothetical protein
MRYFIIFFNIIICSIICKAQDVLRYNNNIITFNNNIVINNNIIEQNWYVKPFGGNYGLENGTSPDNAFDGFININWTNILDNHKLILIGTFSNETCTISKGGSGINQRIYIDGYYNGNIAIIDGQNVLIRCIYLSALNYITIQNLELKNATTDGSYIGGASKYIEVNNVISHNIGNQAFQNEGTGLYATYNYCSGYNCTDDGISLHLNAIVEANYCNFYNNGQGYNAIGTSVFTANYCNFYNNSIACIENDSDSKCYFNNCYLKNSIKPNSSKSMTIINSYLDSCAFSVSNVATGQLYIDKSYLYKTYITQVRQPVNISNSFIRITSALSLTASPARYILTNNVFLTTTDVYSVNNTLNTSSIISNCTFVGTNNVGRGVNCTQPTTVTNCIFYDLGYGLVAAGASAILTDNYNNKFDVTTPKATSGGGIINTTNAIVGDPKLNNVGALDFSLQVGSSCINTGTNTNLPNGIKTATWQNLPNVTITIQNGNYDLGAYIY